MHQLLAPCRTGAVDTSAGLLQLDALLDAILSVLHRKQFGNPSLKEGSQKKMKKKSSSNYTLKSP